MKNKVFFFLMLAVSILLFLLRVTGMTAHIALSVAGIAALVAFAVISKKDWTKPALEILMRVMYLVAIVTGGILMKVHGIAPLGMVHKIGAALFLVLLLVLYIPKCKK